MDNYTMTKIVATLGPASSTKEKIKELFKAGVTMFRLNSSHGDVEMHKQNLAYIREIEEEEKTLIPVLLDLQGPKINQLKFIKEKSLNFVTNRKLQEIFFL